MKYSLDEAVREIQNRREAMLRQRQMRRARALSGAAAALILALVAVVRGFAGAVTSPAAGGAYGSFLLNPGAGGYVLAAVLAFAAGVTVTLACIAHKKHTRRPRQTDAPESEKDT